MIRLFHKYRSEVLLFALIAQIVASPLADSHPLIGAVLAISVLSMILVGAAYIVNNRAIQIIGLLHGRGVVICQSTGGAWKQP
jgi:hypothetical protein